MLPGVHHRQRTTSYVSRDGNVLLIQPAERETSGNSRRDKAQVLALEYLDKVER